MAEKENDPQGALVGGFIAALLAFVSGFYLPMYLSPRANQGPLTGFIVAPFAGAMGAFLGYKISESRTSHLRAFAIAVLAGALLTVIFFVREIKSPDGSDEHTYLGCAVLIFGITGFVVQLLYLKKK